MKTLIINENKFQSARKRCTMKTRILLLTSAILWMSLSESPAQIWEQTNGPYGGNIQSLAVHPSGELYAGVFDGGLFRSTDNGEFWFYVGFIGQGVIDVFIPPSGNIFVTALDAAEWEPYRSTDSGVTWNLVNTNISFDGISCWDSDNSGNIYLAGFRNGIGVDILKSTDEGETWTNWTSHFSLPNDFLFFDSEILMSDDANGVFRLINNSWVRQWPFNVGTNCFELTNNGVLLAGSVGIYRSLDTAATWQQIISGGINQTYVSSLVINAEGFVFAGTSNGVYKSNDDGLTWVQVGLANLRVNTLALKDTITLFAGQNFGVHRLNNSSGVWEIVNNGLYVERTISLAINQKSETFFAATNVGLYRSINFGQAWESILPWLEIEEVFWPNNLIKIPLLIDTNSNFLYTFSREYASLYRSSDDGNTWITSFLPGYNLNCIETGLEAGVLFGGGLSMVFKSSDYGLTWSSTSFDGYGPVQCLDLNTISENLFAGNVGGGIYRSTNQGLNWRSFNVGLINTNMQTIATNSSGDVFLGTYNGVFRSRDQGGNWTWVGLENDTVLAIAINSVGNLLAGTFRGQVYKSSDDGNSWFDFSSGLKNTAIRSLIVDENDFAFIGTVSEGVFRTIFSTVDVAGNNEEVPTKFLLSQNYPNPFNPSTIISWQSPVGSQHTLKIYDMLGNQITTLIDEYKPAGGYEVEFNAASLPSGVYFYQLRASNYVNTKKMLLVR